MQADLVLTGNSIPCLYIIVCPFDLNIRINSCYESFVLHMVVWSQALENEIAAHEGQIREVMKEASALMMASQHGGAGIREKNSELRKAWTELQNLASGRRHMLNDAMEAQKVRGVPHHSEVMFRGGLS